MSSWGALISHNNCKRVTRKRNVGIGMATQAKSLIQSHLIGIFCTAILLTTTIISAITSSREEAISHLCLYFLTYNNWSNPISCDEIFCMEERQVKETYLEFCNKLAWKSIDDTVLKQKEAAVEKRRMMLSNNHKHLKAPTHVRISKNEKCYCLNKQLYRQYKCRRVSCRKNSKKLHL